MSIKANSDPIDARAGQAPGVRPADAESTSAAAAGLLLTELFPSTSVPLQEESDVVSTADDSLVELDQTPLASAAEGPWEDDDKAIKEAFLAGSEEAFLKLYAKYEVALLYYCKRMLRDGFLAEDAFQEIWTRVYELRKRPGVVILHFRGLLFRSARNLCMNYLRNQRPTVSTDEERQELTLDDPMSGEATSREMQVLMLRGLAKLPFEQREAFVLHEYSGFAYAEIARMTETTEQNVKMRAYRARVRLRKFIQGWLGLGETDDPSSFI